MTSDEESQIQSLIRRWHAAPDMPLRVETALRQLAETQKNTETKALLRVAAALANSAARHGDY